jgi:recombinational DNA repair protein (RecF pathway)
MRHKYDTRVLVLARAPLGEISASVVLLTPSLGLLRARAQGLRRSGAKLAAALTTFSESACLLVRGKEGWRVTGAVLEDRWNIRLSVAARAVASRIVKLLLRLSPTDVRDPELFSIVHKCFELLATASETAHEAIEIRTALSLLAVLGLDAGTIPPLDAVAKDRMAYISRINQGISASGL